MKTTVLLIQNSTSPKYMQIIGKHIKSIRNTGSNIEIILSNKKSYTKFFKSADIILPTIYINKIDFAKAKNLKWIHVTSAGVNHLPKTIINSNIRVTNSSGVHPIPIAEQIFGYLLIFARSLHLTSKAQSEKRWLSQENIPVFELHGKTIGIVGLGRIGEKVAQIAKGFDMKVIATTRTSKNKSKYVDELLPSKNLVSLLKKSDFVINCLPATSETYYLFNYKKFSLMKQTSYFINIGRGMSVNEKDLIKALKNKIIAGAGLDVFEEEPLSKSSPLWKMENVIVTPHHAGSTPYYMDRVIEIFCRNLKAYLSKTLMPNLVDKKLGY